MKPKSDSVKKKSLNKTSYRRINKPTAFKKGQAEIEAAEIPSEEDIFKYFGNYASDFDMETGDAYFGTLLSGIQKSGTELNIMPESLLLINMLSNITKSIREVTYKKGISIGRLLSRIISNGKKYMVIEEALLDLSLFFEKCGYKAVSFAVRPSHIWLTFHYPKGYADLKNASSIHTFEAGIISGFLTTAMHNLVEVQEEECIYTGSPQCAFVYSLDRSGKRQESIQKPVAIEDISKFIVERVKNNECQQTSYYMSPLYFNISALSLFEESYFESIKEIVKYLGSNIALLIGFDKEGLAQPDKQQKLKLLFKMLNLGNVTIKSISKLNIKISLNPLSSIRQIAEISASFALGIFENLDKSIYAYIKLQDDGSYEISIATKK
ncbi:MAG: hypothetical protein ACP5LP_00590 [Candidatus Micrarchaeia archaeon]